MHGRRTTAAAEEHALHTRKRMPRLLSKSLRNGITASATAKHSWTGGGLTMRFMVTFLQSIKSSPISIRTS